MKRLFGLNRIMVKHTDARVKVSNEAMMGMQVRKEERKKEGIVETGEERHGGNERRKHETEWSDRKRHLKAKKGKKQNAFVEMEATSCGGIDLNNISTSGHKLIKIIKGTFYFWYFSK